MSLLEHILESKELCSIGVWIMRDPYCEDIINKSMQEKEVVAESLQYFVLKNGKKECSIEWGQRNTHSCTLALLEVGITKFKDIEVHDEPEAFKDGTEGEMIVLMAVAVKELLNLIYGSSGVNLSIHAGGIGSEKLCARWEVEHHELIFKGLGILKVYGHVFSNLVEVVVHPYTQWGGRDYHCRKQWALFSMDPYELL
eukprot:15365070-Ditylum_brightwellii.AAC.1